MNTCEFCNMDKDLFECANCGTIQCLDHVEYRSKEEVIFRCCHCLSENLKDI